MLEKSSGDRVSFPKRRDDLRTSILPDGYLTLFCQQTSWAYALPPIAALTWELLDGAHSVSEIVSEIRALVEEDKTQNLSEDIVAVIEQFSSLGLVTAQQSAEIR